MKEKQTKFGKKFLSLLLALAVAVMVIPLAGMSAADTAGDFQYEVQEDGTAKITGYTGSETELEIPSKIAKYMVTGIDDSAFCYENMLTKVVIPSSVANIGNRAFYGCKNLDYVIVPSSVTYIGNDAFGDVTKILSPQGSYASEYAAKSDLKHETFPVILVNRCPLIIHQGEKLNLDVSYYNEDGMCATVEDYEISGYDQNKTGRQTITVSYLHASTTTSIDISSEKETYLNFPDKNLKEDLKEYGVDKNNDDMISIREMEALNGSLWFWDVYNIEGLEYAVNLRGIYLIGGNFTAEQKFSLNQYWDMQVTVGEDDITPNLRRYVGGDSTIQYKIKDPTILQKSGSSSFQALKVGTTQVTATLGSTSHTFTVTVSNPKTDPPLGAPSNNLPVLQEFQPYEGGLTATALYENGDLYHIGEQGEILMMEDVENYTVAAGAYDEGYLVLDKDKTLWSWGWKADTTEKDARKVAQNVVDYTQSMALLENEDVIEIDSPDRVRYQDAVDINEDQNGKGYALKKDGTLWSGGQIDENVDRFVGIGYVKEDQTTWMLYPSRKLADFAADQFCDARFIGDYLVKDKNLYRVSYDEKAELELLSNDFKEFCYTYDGTEPPAQNDIFGFITNSGKVYELSSRDYEEMTLPCPISEIEKLSETLILKKDGTLWSWWRDEQPQLLMTHVASYIGKSSECYVVRTDGTIWGKGVVVDNVYHTDLVKVADAHNPDTALVGPDDLSEQATVRWISPGSTGTQLMEQLAENGAVASSSTMRLLDASGQELSEDTLLGTGMILEVAAQGGEASRYAIVISGDVTGDGKTTAIDARFILQASTGNRDLSGAQKVAAEISGDGRVTAVDARYLLQTSVGN